MRKMPELSWLPKNTKPWKNAHGFTVDPKRHAGNFSEVACEGYNCFNETLIFVPKTQVEVPNLEQAIELALAKNEVIVVIRPGKHGYLPKGCDAYWGYFRCGASPVTIPLNFGKEIGKGLKPSADSLRKTREGIGHYCHRE